VFPPFPSELRGRRREIATVAAVIAADRPRARVALVGGGGSGKSILACAVGYRVRASFPGGIHWFRSGPWDERTLCEMLALRFGTTRARSRVRASLRRHFAERGPTLVVLDNHENDAAATRLLDEMRGCPVSWLLTARRCLLSGVHLFPVVAPYAATGAVAFPRVRRLAKILRQNPLAMGIADGIVRSGAASAASLEAWLLARGVDRVRVIEHEDDLPEVALLVDWAWRRLGRDARRMLAVLAHAGGDHMDAASLAKLARTAGGRRDAASLDGLVAWCLVQRPLPGRYALHAVVRYSLQRRTRLDPRRLLEHYLGLLEAEPGRLDLEQTHLYAAMDYAHAQSDLQSLLRIDRLLSALGEG
jgi:hypothetical protein